MATYRPSFVDVSGLTQGISKGLEMAAQRKRQEDAISEARVDDFMKMYQPGKLREQDIPDFTTTYNNYKQAALQYSRINRSGGKPEQLAQAKSNMDKAMSGLNEVYNSSVKAANKIAEYGDAIKIARSKGLSVPSEMNQSFSLLSSVPISKLNVDSIPSAYSYKLLSEDADYTKVFKDLDLLGAKAKQSTQFVDNPNSGYTFMGTPLKSRTKVTIETRNPFAIAKAIPTLLADPTHNGLKVQMDTQYDIFKNSDPDTKAQMVEVLKPIFNINTADEVRPDMILAYRLASSNISKQEDDPNFLKIQIDEIKLKNQNAEQAKNRAVRVAGQESKSDVSQPSHPYNIIQGIKQSAQGVTPIDVSKELQRYSLPGMFGKEIISQSTYNPATDMFTVKTRTGEALEISPDALENQIVETSGEYKARKISGKPKAGGLRYKGLDSKGNPIYE